MAWEKIPAENNDFFLTMVPDDPDVATIAMFGGICMTVKGHMAAGTWARSVMARLGEAAVNTQLDEEGFEAFAPVGGRVMKDFVVLPESVMERPQALARFLDEAVAFARTLPPKKPKKPKKSATKRAATKRAPRATKAAAAKKKRAPKK